MLKEFYEMMERDGYNGPYIRSLETDADEQLTTGQALMSLRTSLRRARDLWSCQEGMLLDIQDKITAGCYDARTRRFDED